MLLIYAVLWSLAYGFLALSLAGFVLVIHGDCISDPRPGGLELCTHEKRRMARIAFQMIAGGYGIAVVAYFAGA